MFGDRKTYVMTQLRLLVLAQASHHQSVPMTRRESAGFAFCA
jgi:hypothetical protein